MLNYFLNLQSIDLRMFCISLYLDKGIMFGQWNIFSSKLVS